MGKRMADGWVGWFAHKVMFLLTLLHVEWQQQQQLHDIFFLYPHQRGAENHSIY